MEDTFQCIYQGTFRETQKQPTIAMDTTNIVHYWYKYLQYSAKRKTRLITLFG